MLDAQNGSPLRRAQVRASLLENGETWITNTDRDGRYSLNGLPAGRYNLGATRDGYVGLQFGQRWPGDLSSVIRLADRQVLEQVDYRLPRSGVIAGHVLDEFADPHADVLVIALESRLANGRRVMAPAGRSSVTNDRGEFRISGLNPGRYLITARYRGEPASAASDSRSTYAPTYYPGTTNADDAQPLAVELGQELTGVELSLAPSPTFQITGTLRSSRGAPLLRPTFTLSSPAGMLPPSDTITQQGTDGSFALLRVPPGSYVLNVRAAGSVGGAGADEEFASTALTVVDADISGVDLVTRKGSVLTGEVRGDRRLPLPFDLSRVTVIASPASDEISPGTLNASPVNVDGAFELRGLFGSRVFSVQGLPAGWQLKSASLHGQEVIDTPSHFKGGDNMAGLALVVTNRLTELTGAVVDGAGRPVNDCTVLAFADDNRKWNTPARHVRVDRAEQGGRFRIRGLPPGGYLVAAVGYLTQEHAQDPQFLESVRPHATLVWLAEEDSKSVRLVLADRR